MGKPWKQWDIWFSRPPNSLQLVTAAMKLKDTCSLEEKLWSKSILKSRDFVTLPTKFHLVKAMVFPVVMYRCESWTINKAEHRRIDVFELWCWRKLLRVPWMARRSNQSILKEISPGCSLEGLMLKLKLQYFGHRMQRTDSLEKTLMLGRIDGGGRRVNSGSWWWKGRPGVLWFMGSQRIGHDWVTELNWTELNWSELNDYLSKVKHWKPDSGNQVVWVEWSLWLYSQPM